jgi:hypothetical protein
MHITAQFYALGLDGGFGCNGGVGIGVGFVFHMNLGVARFRSPANTHAIYRQHGGRAGSPLHAVLRNDSGRSEQVWLMFNELQNSSWKA